MVGDTGLEPVTPSLSSCEPETEGTELPVPYDGGEGMGCTSGCTSLQNDPDLIRFHAALASLADDERKAILDQAVRLTRLAPDDRSAVLSELRRRTS